jgi:hypothetical protein
MNGCRAAALDTPSVSRYDAVKAECRIPAFRPTKYLALFCANLSLHRMRDTPLHILKRGVPYKDLGSEYYCQFNTAMFRFFCKRTSVMKYSDFKISGA